MPGQSGMILGEVDEHLPWILDFEALQAGRVRSDGEGQIETEPGLAKLGMSRHEADGGTSPERVDEPSFSRLGFCQLGDPADRQRILAVRKAQIVWIASSLFVSHRSQLNRQEDLVDRLFEEMLVDEALFAFVCEGECNAEELGGHAWQSAAAA